jgi:hypothetical protein
MGTVDDLNPSTTNRRALWRTLGKLPPADHTIPAPQGLFQEGEFALHSGSKSKFKIDCDHLTYYDLRALAGLAFDLLPPFGEVVGIPTGGTKFAEALVSYGKPEVANAPRLLVDDVMTTGSSMIENYRPGDIGLVIFSRTLTYPAWIRSIFTLTLDVNER